MKNGEKPTQITIMRVYESSKRTDKELRVLIDRLWPRGIKKTELDFDEWVKSISPSTNLRKWYGHEPGRFEEFAIRYRDELSNEPTLSECLQLLDRAKGNNLVLLSATKNLAKSSALVLKMVLEELSSTS